MPLVLRRQRRRRSPGDGVSAEALCCPHLGGRALLTVQPSAPRPPQVNSTTKYFKGNFQDPTFFAAVPIQAAADREIARFQWAAAGRTEPLTWDVSTSQFAHPATGNINIVGQAMGPFVFAAGMFNFVLLVSGTGPSGLG
jgi:hypothetical protein